MKTLNSLDAFANLKPGDPWPETGLEFLGHCPACGSGMRHTLYEGLTDRIYDNPGLWTYHRCKECGCVYLDPRPNRTTIGLAYTNYLTHTIQTLPPRPPGRISELRLALRNDYLNWRYGYHMKPQHPFGRIFMYLLPPFLRHEWDRYARHLPRPKPGTDQLLDVGCGSGDFLLQARETGWQVQGLDFDPKAVEVARSRGLEVALGGLDEQRYPDAFFDVVTHSHVVEHVHDPVGFLRECLRVLKPGGLLWMATPNLASLGHRAYGRNWHLLHPPNHLTLFSPSALLRALRQAGADDVRHERRGFHVAPTWASTLAVLRGEPPFWATLPKMLVPVAWAVEVVDSLLPRFQEELVITARKPFEEHSK